MNLEAISDPIPMELVEPDLVEFEDNKESSLATLTSTHINLEEQLPLPVSMSYCEESSTSKSSSNGKDKDHSKSQSRSRRGQSSKPKRSTTRQNKEKLVTEDPKFSFSYGVKEDHGTPILGVAFHTKLKPGQPDIFATVGRTRVSIYQCKLLSIQILQVYEEPDVKEIFNTCDWSNDLQGNPLLAAAGIRGVIRILSPQNGTCVKDLIGHCGGINHLVFHPRDCNLLLSASQDHSLRLWNVVTKRCVAIFGGAEGHRDEVLTADFSLDGTKIVSGGMDHSLKVWNSNSTELATAIQHSYNWQSEVIQNGDVAKVEPYATMIQCYSDYVTREVHHNYVDCVKWFGDFILSKSCENEIVCWKGGSTFQQWNDILTSSKIPKENKVTIIHRWQIEKCDSLWYIRFGLDLDAQRKRLAVGNEIGETFMFDLNREDPLKIVPSLLKHPSCTAAIRQTAFSRDGSILICVCEDSTIWRWDLVNTKQIMMYMNNDIQVGRKVKKRSNGISDSIQVPHDPVFLSEDSSD